ncbi:MAG: cohesin domain-containing protein, partial [Thermoplasmatota archaeon]
MGGLAAINNPISEPTTAQSGEDVATVAITPEQVRSPVGEQITVNLSINSSEPLTAASIALTFNASVLHATSVNDGGMFSVWGPSLSSNVTVIDNENGTIETVMAFNIEGNATNGTLATITFETVGDGTSTIDFSSISLKNATRDSMPLADIDAQPATVLTTITIVQVSSANAGIDTQMSVDINITPAVGLKVFQCDITFNQSIVEAVEVIDGGMFNIWDMPGAMEIDNDNGVIKNISGVNKQGNVTNTSGTFATIVFNGIEYGQTPIKVTNVVTADADYEFVQSMIYNGTITVDGIKPQITDNTLDTATTGDEFTFNATVTDNLNAVDTVTVEYWYDGEAPTTEIMQPGSDYTYTTTIENTTDDLHYYINATDTSGNWNRTEEATVTVED